MVITVSNSSIVSNATVCEHKEKFKWQNVSLREATSVDS